MVKKGCDSKCESHPQSVDKAGVGALALALAFFCIGVIDYFRTEFHTPIVAGCMSVRQIISK